MTFSFNKLSRPLLTAISELGYKEPTEIQSIAIPILLEGSTNFVGQAQTGTGKTAAFCLPLLEKLDLDKKAIQAIILSPTRELASQINQDILRFARYLPIKTATVYGGVGYGDQLNNLRKANIVVATPGRAIDLLKRGKLNINDCKFFIIDEADEMLKMGFIDDVELLMKNVSNSAQTWMFSATMPGPIVRLIEKKLNFPKIIRIKKKRSSDTNISQSFCHLQKKDFIKALKVILLTEENFFGIVFCETKEETKNLSKRLIDIEKRVVTLHGDLDQKQRDIAMEQFKNKKADILVCTDVAARGLDISQVTHVINMGLPRRPDSYIHRIGRTGRAGQVGKAISFVAPSDSKNLKIIERITDQKLTNFPLPCPFESKRKRVSVELERMHRLKKTISERGSDFHIDDSFEVFSKYLMDMSKEDIIKLLFSYSFDREFRSIDESLENLKNSMLSRPEFPTGRPQRTSKRDRNKKRSSYRGRRHYR